MKVLIPRSKVKVNEIKLDVSASAENIYQSKGIIKGFYAGSLPNLTRLVLRNSYKYPLLVGLPDFFRTKAPRGVHDNPSVLKFFTGFSIALIESIITCPIDRIKTYLMTQ